MGICERKSAKLPNENPPNCLTKPRQIDTGTSQFPGKLDEVRISKVARSSEWIKATYDTIKDNATFTSYGVAQENAKGGFIIIVR